MVLWGSSYNSLTPGQLFNEEPGMKSYSLLSHLAVLGPSATSAVLRDRAILGTQLDLPHARY